MELTEKFKPGTYEVQATFSGTVLVKDGKNITLEDALLDITKTGELLDWSVDGK